MVSDRPDSDESGRPALDVRPPRRRQVLATLVAVMFVLAGIVLATGPIVVSVVGIAAILFFGPIAIYQLTMLARGRPRVLLDERGLTDHASPAGAGLLPWSQIRGARVEDLDDRTRLVVVDVVDPDEVLRRSGRLARRSKQMTLERYGSPVVIPVRGLGVRADDLSRAIGERIPDA